jgi:hypothetical protein
MTDVTENGLRAAVKALTDIVAPAINHTDPLAIEQLRLVVDYLEFVRRRLDYLHDRDRFELDHNLAMARALDTLGAPGSGATMALLKSAIQDGAHAQAFPAASSPALKSAAAALAAAVRELIRESAAFDAQIRLGIERCVLDATDERITFDRAWYLPLGFDPAGGEVPALADLLAKAPSG